MAQSSEELSQKKGLGERILERGRELHATGIEWGQAYSKAWLEERISQWPQGWGDDLVILIYGDFDPPEAEMYIEQLGITIHPDKLENTVIQSALCVLKATVRVEEKSVDALVDAARRINVLLGAWTLVQWGNSACGWWSWVTHDTGGGVLAVLDHEDLPGAIDEILRLPDSVRQKVDNALYWLRAPRNILSQFYRSDLLQMYTGYWNAFECLVEAVGLFQPQKKLSSAKKQRLINEFMSQRAAKLTTEDIHRCYHEIVDPGFVGKASHALKVCFPNKEADMYITECFRAADEHQRLYNIRNAINHGEVDAENPDELIRIESRLHVLWLIVWRMFSGFVRFPAPANPLQIVSDTKKQDLEQDIG